MLRLWSTRYLLALAPLVVLAGCSSSSGSADDGTSGSTGSSGTASQGQCATDTRQDHYAAGLAKTTASGLSIQLMASTPAPPQKETNDLTLRVVDAQGKAVDGATLSLLPFMPDHGHGTSVKPTVTPKGDGTYDVSNVYLTMPGLWRLTVTVQQSNATPQSAAFQFCVDG